MTTAQLVGRISLDTYGDFTYREPKGTVSRQRKSGTACSGVRSRTVGLTGAVLAVMEREDTVSDKLAGYGLCGFTLFYLGAHLVKLVF